MIADLMEYHFAEEEVVILSEAIDIFREEVESFAKTPTPDPPTVGNDGWIPVTERFPEPNKYIFLSFSNFSLPVVGRYEEDEDGGAFYMGDDDESCVSQDMFVNAWQQLPEPYKEGERI